MSLKMRMCEASPAAMGGLVLDCYICHRMMIYPVHIKKFLRDWNKNGRTCIRCLVKYKYPDLGLEGYIEELEHYRKEVGWET